MFVLNTVVLTNSPAMSDHDTKRCFRWQRRWGNCIRRWSHPWAVSQQMMKSKMSHWTASVRIPGTICHKLMPRLVSHYRNMHQHSTTTITNDNGGAGWWNRHSAMQQTVNTEHHYWQYHRLFANRSATENTATTLLQMPCCTGEARRT